MSRFIPHTDMSADDLIQRSYQARAIISLCEGAAWAIQNGGAVDLLAGSIGSALRLSLELLEPVHDALELHEGRRAAS